MKARIVTMMRLAGMLMVLGTTLVAADALKVQDLFEDTRIPSIDVATDGTVLAFANNGKTLRRSEDGGKTWSMPTEVGNDAGGKAIVDQSTGDVLLVNTGKGWLHRSKDHGKTWEKEAIVIQPNAYGHGLQLAAGAFTEAGADWLGVSTVAEGVRLREAGLELPVLVFLPALADELEALIEHQLTGTIVASNEIQAYVEATEKVGRDAQVHVYVDTGLGRLGSDDPLAEILARAEVHPRLNVSAIYTHFGPGASGTMLGGIDDLKPGASARAFATLAAQTARETSTAGIDLHCAASALFLQASEAHLDMVRIGTLLYGQKPSEALQDTMKLRKTFELRSHIVAIQTLPSGSPVGYGGACTRRRHT